LSTCIYGLTTRRLDPFEDIHRTNDMQIPSEMQIPISTAAVLLWIPRFIGG
jgi:hypothetical protein